MEEEFKGIENLQPLSRLLGTFNIAPYVDMSSETIIESCRDELLQKNRVAKTTFEPEDACNERKSL